MELRKRTKRYKRELKKKMKEFKEEVWSSKMSVYYYTPNPNLKGILVKRNKGDQEITLFFNKSKNYINEQWKILKKKRRAELVGPLT